MVKAKRKYKFSDPDNRGLTRSWQYSEQQCNIPHISNINNLFAFLSADHTTRSKCPLHVDERASTQADALDDNENKRGGANQADLDHTVSCKRHIS